MTLHRSRFHFINQHRSLIVITLLMVVLVGIFYYVYNNKDLVTTIEPVDTRAELETRVKNPPPLDAPQSERLEYVTWASDSAIQTNMIDINECSPEPIIVQVTPSSEITFVNNDVRTHFIMFNPNFYFEVPAGSSKSVKVDVNDKPGIFPYRCDNTEKVGIVVVKK